jgi:hypothetical protein
MTTHVLPGLFRGLETIDLHIGRALRGVSAMVLQSACAVRGHAYFVKRGANRIFLQCADCGHETHGWYLDIRPNRPAQVNPAIVGRPAVRESARTSLSVLHGGRSGDRHRIA